MRYSELTRRYFETAPSAGVLGAGSCRGAAGSRACGTWVQFDVLASPASSPSHAPGTVRAVRFLAFGCPHVIAVSAWLAEQAVGGAAVARLPESVHALRERFGVPVEKLGRLLVIEDAWLAAMRATAHGGPA
jgi:NifU-like protein involved in Fe-S cluster formation